MTANRSALKPTATHRLGVHLAIVWGVVALAAAVPIGRLRSEDESPAAKAKKIKQEVADAVAAKDAVRLSGLITRMAKLDDPAIAAVLLDAAVLVPSAKNYEAARQTIIKFRNDATLDGLIKLVEGSTPAAFRQRVLVLEAFGHRRDSKTLDAISKALSSKSVHTQVAAIQACVIRKEKGVIPALIELLGKEAKQRSRAWIETREALLALTGHDFETIEDWQKFWEGNKDSIDPKNLDRSKGPTQVVVKKAEDSQEFFGREIFSQRVVFVIDCSGSMLVYKDDPAYTGKNIKFDGQRLTRAKNQMLNTVRKLRKGCHFNIITFSDRVQQWQKQVVPAGPQNFTSAQKFVKGFQAVGLTHTDEAIEKAFEDLTADTIVLLSDGAPAKMNAAGTDLIEKIHKRVQDLNASRKLRIDTFGFEDEGIHPNGQKVSNSADDPMVGFLKKLAKDNGGTYQPIK